MYVYLEWTAEKKCMSVAGGSCFSSILVGWKPYYNNADENTQNYQNKERKKNNRIQWLTRIQANLELAVNELTHCIVTQQKN